MIPNIMKNSNHDYDCSKLYHEFQLIDNKYVCKQQLIDTISSLNDQFFNLNLNGMELNVEN